MEKVEFVLGPSRRLGLFLWILYVSTVIIILWLPIFLLLKIILSLGLFLYCWQCWNFHARRIVKKSVVRLWQDTEGRWGCQTKGGHLAMGKLKGDSFKSIWFMILRFRLQGRSLSVIIPADAVSSIEYRVLSARINYFL